jgi:hypothetical protein
MRSRTEFQTGRPGWRPRKRSQKQLCFDIATSIIAHHTRGEVDRGPQHYTQDEGLIVMVVEELARIQAAF